METEKLFWKRRNILLTGFKIVILKWTVLVIIHVENKSFFPFFSVFLSKQSQIWEKELETGQKTNALHCLFPMKLDFLRW